MKQIAKLVFVLVSLVLGLNWVQAQNGEFYATVEKETSGEIVYVIQRGGSTPPRVGDKTWDDRVILWTQTKPLKTNTQFKEPVMSAVVYQRQIKRAMVFGDNRYKPKYTDYWFSGLKSLEYVEGLETLNTEALESMAYMFKNCSSLRSIDISCFTLSKLTRASGMFDGCTSLTSIDLTKWAGGLSNNDADFYGQIFRDCSSLEYVFSNEDAWWLDNVNKNTHVEHIGGGIGEYDLYFNYTFEERTKNMFQGCTSLKGVRTDGLIVPFDPDKVDGNSFCSADKGGYITVKRNLSTKEVGILPKKTLYKYGEALDLTGGYVTQKVGIKGTEATYNMKIVSLEAVAHTLKGYDSTKIGTQRLSVECYGQEVFFEVRVEDGIDGAQKYEVVKYPTKTEYTMPFTKDELDLSGGVIRKYYLSGATYDVPMEKLYYTFDKNLVTTRVGNQEVDLSIHYDKQFIECKYTILIKDAIKDFQLAAAPSKREYVMPFTASDLSLEGGKIKINYYSGNAATKVVDMKAQNYTISGLNPEKSGEQEITVDFTIDGKHFEYKYTIKVYTTIKELSVVSEPTTNKYLLPFTAADLDLKGGKIKKVYKSGKEEEFYMESTQYTSNLEENRIGEQTITLNFDLGDTIFRWKHKIEVEGVLESVSVLSEPAIKAYMQPFYVSDLNLRGGVIQKVYNNVTVELPMDSLKYDVRGLKPAELGKQTVSLNFHLGDTNLDWQYEIEIIPGLTEIYVEKEPSKREYTMPVSISDISLRGGVIMVESGGNSTMLSMPDLEYTISGLDTENAGEQTLTVEFNLSSPDTVFVYQYDIMVLEAETGSGDEPGVDEPGAGEGGEGGEEGGGSEEGGSGEEGGGSGDGDNGGKEEGGQGPGGAAEDLVCGGAAFEAWASGGVLSVSVARGGVLEVLSVNGVVVRRLSLVGGGSLRLPLERGVYVLRLGGEVRKVVVE